MSARQKRYRGFMCENREPMEGSLKKEYLRS